MWQLTSIITKDIELDGTVSPKITQNDFQESNHAMFQEQPFQDVLQNKCS